MLRTEPSTDSVGSNCGIGVVRRYLQMQDYDRGIFNTYGESNFISSRLNIELPPINLKNKRPNFRKKRTLALAGQMILAP